MGELKEAEVLLNYAKQKLGKPYLGEWEYTFMNMKWRLNYGIGASLTGAYSSGGFDFNYKVIYTPEELDEWLEEVKWPVKRTKMAYTTSKALLLIPFLLVVSFPLIVLILALLQ